MKPSLRLEGAKELDKILERLKASTARGVTRRAMTKALEPVAVTARALAPKRSGQLAAAIGVSSTLTKRQRREAKISTSRDVQTVYVGSPWRGAHLVEFGTGPRYHKSGKFVGAMPPQPFMRPAWDQNREQVLASLTDSLRIEIDKTLTRAAKRAAKGK